MDNLQISTVFICLDGDKIGANIAHNFLNDSVEGVQEVSDRINVGQDLVMKWANDHKGKVISWGGDESSFEVPQAALEDLEQLRADYEFCVGATCSVGCGKKLSEAAKSLLVAKERGRNMVVTYDQSVESDYAKMQGNESPEQAPADDTQLTEKSEDGSNMENSNSEECKYCNDAEDSGCKHCDDMDQANQEHIDSDDCPHCQDTQDASDLPIAPESDQEDEDCQYCDNKEETECPHCDAADEKTEDSYLKDDNHGRENTQLPFDPDGNPNASPDKTVPGMGPDDFADNGSLAPGEEPSFVDNDPNYEDEIPQDPQQQGMLQPEPTQTAVDQILGQIDNPNAPNSPETTGDVMSHIDDTDMAVGANMEDDTSRPDGYDRDKPSDLGLAEDEDPNDSPDLSSVLKDGLDEHADNIQKEKIVQMVSEALEGFKASKDLLDRAMTDAPEFYGSCVKMVQSMVMMAQALGIGQEMSEDDIQEMPEEEQEEQQESNGRPQATHDNPFPKHQDQGGEDNSQPAPQEGAAEGKP